jgi:hypothetical protein
LRAQVLVQQLAGVVLPELAVAVEFVGRVGCKPIVVVVDRMMVEVVGHTAVRGNRSRLHSQQDCKPLSKEELVAWRAVLGKYHCNQQMCVDFAEYNQWRLSSNPRGPVVSLARLSFQPALLWLRPQHEKMTLVVQGQVVLLWAMLARQLNKMCVQRPTKLRELFPVAVVVVVVDRLGHKNTFDLVVDGLDLVVEHSFLVMEVVLGVQ